jgi:2-C-methyl-D-erythritol 4-phosphate cytidylyltransferase
MELCARVAGYKRSNVLPVFQGARESEILERVRESAPDWLKFESSLFFKSIMQISKNTQNKLLSQSDAPTDTPLPPQAQNSVSVIIAAAGESTRFNGANKQLAPLCGIPVIARSMLLFEELPEVSEIIVSAREEDMETIRELASRYNVTKLSAVTKGGNTRQASVFSAYGAVSKETRYIAVHDGARPLASPQVVRRCVKDASVFGAVVPGVPVKDTLKTVDGGMVSDTPDRKKLYSVQTPQVFRKDLYVAGINFAKEHGLDFTDDCQLVESVGVKVCVTESDCRNIKITTPEDLTYAEAVLC